MNEPLNIMQDEISSDHFKGTTDSATFDYSPSFDIFWNPPHYDEEDPLLLSWME